MPETEDENEGGGSRFAALALIGVMATTALVAAWILLSPEAKNAAPSPDRTSVFEDARVSERLKEKLHGVQDTRRERESTLETPPALATAEPEPAGEARPPETRAPASSERGGSTWKIMKKAENYFFGLKKSKRFKRSKGIKAFRKDFLADSELAEINRRYYKEHRNAVRFVVETVKSASFRRVAKKHIVNADVSAFVNSMMGSNSVVRAARAVSKEFSLKPYIDALPIPGLGSLGGIKAKGKGLQAPPSERKTMEMMNLDPDALDVNKLLEKSKRKRR
jgi:hypothetical protein